MKPFFKILLLLLVVFAAAGCQSDAQKKVGYYEKAKAYYEKSEYRKAEVELKNALQIDPGYIDAYHLLAKNMMKLGNIKDAFRVYNKIIQLNDKDITANLKIAEFLILGKKPEQAMEKINFILEKEPENLEALLVKGQIFFQMNFKEKAFSTFEKVLEISPDNIPALQKIAQIHAINKKFDAAENALLKTVEIAPANLPARLILIGFYLKQKKVDKVEYQLKQAIEKMPDSPEPLILLGNMYFNQKKNSLAEEQYLKAVEVAPKSIKPYLVAAGFYDKSAQKDKAIDFYKRAEKIEPDNMALKTQIARLHYKYKDVETAEKILSDILSKRAGFYQARMLKSEILISKKEFADALQILADLEKEEPKAERVHYFKGLAFIGTGDREQAKSAISKAVELNPRYFKARMLLADLFLQERSYDFALKEAEEALKIDSSQYRLRMIKANALVGMRRLDEAQNVLNDLIKLYPDEPTAYYQIGLLNTALKKYDTALDYLGQAYAKNNKLIDVFSQILKIQVIKKQFDTAHELCKSQMEIFKEIPALYAVVHTMEAGVFLAEKKVDSAIASLQQAIKLYPDNLKPYNTLATIYLAQKDWENALDQYQKILEKNPKLPYPHMMIGTILDSKKQFEKAAAHYKKALEINPEFAPAANNLAYHYLKRTENYDEALRLARIAKSKLPEDPGVMDTLGLAYYQKGFYGNAMNEFLDSLNKIPENAVVNYHLGLAYHKKGDQKLAITALKKALEINDQFEEAAQAKKLLSQLEKE